MGKSMKDDRIGAMLVNEGLITNNELERALQAQEKHGGRLGEIVVSQGSCSEDEVFQQLSHQLQLPRLQDWDAIPENIFNVEFYGIEESWWLRQRAFPLGERDGEIWLALPDVMDTFVVDVLKQQTEKKVLPVIVTEHQLRQLLALLESSEEIIDFADDNHLHDLAAGAPIIKFVNDTIQRAVF